MGLESSNLLVLSGAGYSIESDRGLPLSLVEEVEGGIGAATTDRSSNFGGVGGLKLSGDTARARFACSLPIGGGPPSSSELELSHSFSLEISERVGESGADLGSGC